MRNDEDRESFLRVLGEVCQPTGWRVHAFVLMTNHYHLLVETPQLTWSQACAGFMGEIEVSL